ncbi:nuclear transport factor 2 family protein [Pimelobacter simplex]|uniref:nuclear transport factor 2 family protein n=1 Tax=Nocardioides simplex TaxID=2045 RepID=UPI003AAFECDA
MPEPMIDLADRFFAAAAAHDLDAVRALYADDARIWHNWDDHEQDVDENLATLGSLPQRYDRFDYDAVRTVALPDGFVRQHDIVVARGDRSARVPAILRGYVADGRITRIEEYFDLGQLAAVRAG